MNKSNSLREVKWIEIESKDTTHFIDIHFLHDIADKVKIIRTQVIIQWLFQLIYVDKSISINVEVIKCLAQIFICVEPLQLNGQCNKLSII
mgnify:CR=1 FL=1